MTLTVRRPDSPTADATLAPGITTILARTTVDAPALTADVHGTELTAKTSRDLVGKLTAELYEQEHAGRAGASVPRVRSFRDRTLEARYRTAMPHPDTRLPARVIATHSDGSAEVLLDGVRVLVPRIALIAPADPVAGEDVVLRLSAARPALSRGFFLVDSSRGRPGGHPLLRVYLHLPTPEHAVRVWAAALEVLEAARLPYRAKVSSSAHLFPRRDALVVYLGRSGWRGAELLRSALTGHPDLGAETSTLAHRVGPGLAVAWEPSDNRPDRTGLSFGEHRCSVLAEALVTHAEAVASGDDEGETRTEAVERSLYSAGIDPRDPARNLGSPRLTDLGL